MNKVTVSREWHPSFDVQVSLHYKRTTRVQCNYGGLKSRHELAINSPLSIWSTSDLWMVDRPRFLRTARRQETWWRMYSHTWRPPVRTTTLIFITTGRAVIYGYIEWRQNRKRERINTKRDYSVYKIAVGVLPCTGPATVIYAMLLIDENKFAPATCHAFLWPRLKLVIFFIGPSSARLKELRNISRSEGNAVAEPRKKQKYVL